MIYKCNFAIYKRNFEIYKCNCTPRSFKSVEFLRPKQFLNRAHPSPHLLYSALCPFVLLQNWEELSWEQKDESHFFLIPKKKVKGRKEDRKLRLMGQWLKITKKVSFSIFPKLTIFGIFDYHSKSKRSSLRSQCWIRLFL